MKRPRSPWRRNAAISRRDLLAGLGGAALGAPLALRSRSAAAASSAATRAIFFYFPHGVAADSPSGEPSAWHPTGTEHSFSLTYQLEALEAWRDRCVFLRGVGMGDYDNYSHPGGAAKLLTAANNAANESIDQYLARTAGAADAFSHLYLGVMACQNSRALDAFISYALPETPIAPEDDPAQAFDALFNSGGDARTGSVLDAVNEDLRRLQSRLGGVEAQKLEYLTESLRELERRVETSGSLSESCETSALDLSGFSADTLYEHARFPAILKAQTDLMVLAMRCGFTRVGTIQCSFHTGDLIMSRFEGTEMYDPSTDMRSHQASHYGSSLENGAAELSAFLAQRRWFVSQFAYLLEQLDAVPEGDGTMLDNSVVVLCSEVSDGSSHNHDNMPFIVAGGGGGAIEGGRLLSFEDEPHGNLWVSVANALGEDIARFGDRSTGPLPGLLR